MNDSANLAFTGKQKDAILEELWMDAIFNDQSLSIIRKIAENADVFDQYAEELTATLATTRNRNAISPAQQRKLGETVVAFFGLSVGSHAARTWMMESRAQTIKISDPDTIDPSNLNRLSLGWNVIGEYKRDILENELKRINPYTRVIATSVTGKNSMKAFLNDAPIPHIIIDEIDDLEGKIILRTCAREKKIPLVSATDVGDNVILDVERYDQATLTPIFLGRVPSIENVSFDSLSGKERIQLILQLVGFEACSVPMLESLLALGSSLATWPQLGATATIAGGLITTTIKKIILDEPVESGRYIVSLDSLLVKNYSNTENEQRRQKLIHELNDKWFK